MIAGALLVAGGQGKRMGTVVPKQLLTLGGATILEQTLRPFVQCSAFEQIVIVAAETTIEHIKDIIHTSFPCSPPVVVVKGGPERQDSVFNGLMALYRDIDIVAIHDAVRPFITGELILECLSCAEKYGAVSVMRPLKETVKVVKDGVVVETPERSKLWITQTPQAFRKELIVEAHRKAGESGFTGTDDCMLVERLGYPVHVVEGSDINIKVTTQTDLAIAGAILKLLENGRV